MTYKQLGVKFRVMTEEERESYLGDLIGHGVTEEERYGGILANIEKTGEQTHYYSAKSATEHKSRR